MHRLWGLRARLPGEGDFRRRRDAGSVEELHRAEQAVLQGPSRSEARNEILTLGFGARSTLDGALADARALCFCARRPARRAPAHDAREPGLELSAWRRGMRVASPRCP